MKRRGTVGHPHTHTPTHWATHTQSINYAMWKAKSCPRRRNTEAKRKIERHLRQFLIENGTGNSEEAGQAGVQEQDAGLQCAISRLQTRNRKGCSSGRREGQQLFYWQREELSSDDFHWIFLPSEPLYPGYCVWVVYGSCMYVCVCGLPVSWACQKFVPKATKQFTQQQHEQVALQDRRLTKFCWPQYLFNFSATISLCDLPATPPLLPQILTGLS